MTDPFVHLHVASGYSLRHGASHPRDLVARAAEHGMDALALTDRDGMYGAVKFATACAAAGVRPLFGVDLAVAPVPCPPARRPATPPAAPAAQPGRDGAPARPAAAPSSTARPTRRPVLLSRGATGCRGSAARPRRPRLGRAVPAGLGHPPGR
jgi:error-prone DNA polymerase